MNDVQRLTVNMSDETAETLRAVMRDRGITATEATRRAIGFLGFMEATYRAGRTVVTETPDGQRNRLIYPASR